MKKFLLTLAMAFSAHSFAAQYVPLDSTQVLKVSLSFTHHNRIGIVEDRIKRVFFKNNNISLDIEDVTGQIFIQALRMPCPNTTISLVTSSGEVQELELSFMDCPSEVVLLTKSSACPQMIPCHTLDESFIATIVNGFLKGKLPEDYQSIEDPEKPVTIKCGLKLQRINRLISNQQIVFVYRLINDSKKARCVTECEANILDGDWVFLDRYQLQPQETALVLIGCLR